MNVSIISFSSRKHGNCHQISEYALSLYPNAKVYYFSDFRISGCGHCLCQCFEKGDKCPYALDKTREMLDAVTNSDLAIYVVPNYCDYPCSNYFAFNERSICYFRNNESLLSKYLYVPKKFIVVSNSNKDNFKHVFSYQTVDTPDILFLASYEYGKDSIAGNLPTSDVAMDDEKKFLLK